MIERSAFGEDHLRWARCSDCGMGWVESEHQQDGFLPPGARGHECPPPFDPETAGFLCSHFATSGIPTSQRIKARIVLGLRTAP